MTRMCEGVCCDNRATWPILGERQPWPWSQLMTFHVICVSRVSLFHPVTGAWSLSRRHAPPAVRGTVFAGGRVPAVLPCLGIRMLTVEEGQCVRARVSEWHVLADAARVFWGPARTIRGPTFHTRAKTREDCSP